MVGLLVFLAVTQQTESLYRVLPPVDPSNGFYNYVRAAERLRVAKFRRDSLSDLATAEETTPLAIASQQADAFRDVLPMIELGNSMDVFEPRKSETLSTLYPELSGFMSIATLATHAQYAEFARGKVAEGYRWLAAGLGMAQRLPKTDLLHFNVGIACGVLMDRAILEQLPKLSVNQMENLRRLLGEAPGPDIYRGFWQKDRENFLRYPYQIITDLPGTGVSPEDQPKIRPIREGDRATFEVLSRIWFRDLHREGLAALDRPEKDWLAKMDGDVDPSDKVESFVRYMKAQKIELDVCLGFLFAVDIIDKLGTGESDGVSLGYLLKARTHHRLMLAHIALAIYRLTYRRYPNTLAEAGIEDDPLTGKPFTYALFDGKAYRLESEGVPETGPIRAETSSPAKASRVKGARSAVTR